MKNKIYRQGDVLIQRIQQSIPKEAELIPNDNERVILAYGEVTGHAHALPAQKSSLYMWKGDRLLEIKEATSLTHEEHAPIALQPGVYKVIQQKEYTPQGLRNVAD
jgi:hypothetical protein